MLSTFIEFNFPVTVCYSSCVYAFNACSCFIHGHVSALQAHVYICSHVVHSDVRMFQLTCCWCTLRIILHTKRVLLHTMYVSVYIIVMLFTEWTRFSTRFESMWPSSDCVDSTGWPWQDNAIYVWSSRTWPKSVEPSRILECGDSPANFWYTAVNNLYIPIIFQFFLWFLHNNGYNAHVLIAIYNSIIFCVCTYTQKQCHHMYRQSMYA